MLICAALLIQVEGLDHQTVLPCRRHGDGFAILHDLGLAPYTKGESMRIIYIADDGTQFNNEYECKDYEWLQEHPHLKDIQLYDENGFLFEESILSKYVYTHVEVVVVKTLAAAIEMKALAQYTSFWAYADINRVGMWKWDKDKEMFRLVVGAEV